GDSREYARSVITDRCRDREHVVEPFSRRETVAALPGDLELAPELGRIGDGRRGAASERALQELLDVGLGLPSEEHFAASGRVKREAAAEMLRDSERMIGLDHIDGDTLVARADHEDGALTGRLAKSAELRIRDPLQRRGVAGQLTQSSQSNP